MLSGEKRHLKQKFVVAHTQSSNMNMLGLTAAEKKVIKAVEWFSLEKIQNCPEIIYPVGLADLLPPILVGEYPQEPQKIILGKKPNH
ncbi:MAG: hypothetical protein O2897_06280 [bacterium]|nr:hypothetical protein [bacterium]